MPFVLVHGGGFAASCWDPLVPLLQDDVHAVDLPGRGSRPADLRTVDHLSFIEAVVGEIEAARLSDVVLVGHSMAGITLPGVIGRVADRLRRVVFVSCCVPPDGARVVDTLPADVQAMAREEDPDLDAPPRALDHEIARTIFCNDMDDDQTSYTLKGMVPEAPRVIFERVDLGGLDEPVPRTFVKLLGDAILTPDSQDRMIANMGGAETVSLDSGHMAMISHPAELAAILNAL